MTDQSSERSLDRLGRLAVEFFKDRQLADLDRLFSGYGQVFLNAACGIN